MYRTTTAPHKPCNSYNLCSSLKPVVIALTTLFPVAAIAAPVVSASGYYDIQSQNFYSPITQEYESGGFLQTPTTTAFSQSATSIKGYNKDYEWTNTSPGWTPASIVSANYDGTSKFATSIANAQFWSSGPIQQATTSVHFSDTIFNNGSSAQNAVFDFNIDSIAFAFTPDQLNEWYTHRAGFSASIYLNGSTNSLWSSSFSVTAPFVDQAPDSTGTFSDWNTAGYDLGLASVAGSAVCETYNCGFSISGLSESLNLGSLAAGESLTLSYVVTLWTETNAYGGDASVSFNDPSSLSGSQPTASLHLEAQSSSVPEPGSLALASAGLALLGGISGRRKNSRR